jgi:hypothetical protein
VLHLTMFCSVVRCGTLSIGRRTHVSRLQFVIERISTLMMFNFEYALYPNAVAIGYLGMAP